MPVPAYMRMRLDQSDLHGPHAVCGEENLWEIHEFWHQISGNEPENVWSRSNWDTKHKVMKVTLELGAYLPKLYAVNVGNSPYLNSVEIFWFEYSETQKKNHFYFKHTIYPVKITSIQMHLPNIKNMSYQNMNHLVSIQFRYRWIEHTYAEGNLTTKSEWKYFFADECSEQIPEEYMSGRCLSHDALEWEEGQKKQEQAEEMKEFSLECIDLDGNPISNEVFQFLIGPSQMAGRSTVQQGSLSRLFEKKKINRIEIVHHSEAVAV
jgi:type VI secretion system Hcp family effector